MKITASKRDDILKRKAAYEADAQSRKARHDDQYRTYRNKVQDVYNSVQAQVQDKLAGIPLDLDVRASAGLGEDEIQVNISANQSNIFDKASALSWDYKVSLLKDGTIKKESSSWSGLKACTSEQMNSLKATVKALDIINSLDWANILNVSVPAYNDYVTEDDPKYDPDKPNFADELFDATIEEIMGTNTGILCACSEGSRRWIKGIACYYFIVAETPKFYTVWDVAKNYINNPPENMSPSDILESNRRYTYKIAKSKLRSYVDDPIVTEDFSKYMEDK